MDLKKRLTSVIKKDKENNPKYINEVLKSDLYYLINNYFEVSFNDITIETSVVEDRYDIVIKAKGDRMKMFGVLPE